MAWTERYVRSDAPGGGDGTTDSNAGANAAFTLAEAITHSTSNTGIRYNIRAGTYSFTTTTHTFSGNGTTTAPNWWRGFTATPGDLDAEPTTARVAGTDTPLFTFTSGRILVSGTHQIFSNICMTGSATGANPLLNTSVVANHFHRIRVENTTANASARAMTVTGTANGTCLSNCWFKTTATATSVILLSNSTTLIGCIFEGGASGVGIGSAAATHFHRCVWNNTGGDGINYNSSSTVFNVTQCSFYSCSGDGIEFVAIPNACHLIANCIFSECGGYAINNSTGANTNLPSRVGNVYYSNTSGNENGFGDSPAFAALTDGASPFTNGAGGDLSLDDSSVAIAGAQPHLFENQTYFGYADAGAVQHEDAGGGGSGIAVLTGGGLVR
jgi:hypothetical protein